MLGAIAIAGWVRSPEGRRGWCDMGLVRGRGAILRRRLAVLSLWRRTVLGRRRSTVRWLRVLARRRGSVLTQRRCTILTRRRWSTIMPRRWWRRSTILSVWRRRVLRLSVLATRRWCRLTVLLLLGRRWVALAWWGRVALWRVALRWGLIIVRHGSILRALSLFDDGAGSLSKEKGELTGGLCFTCVYKRPGRVVAQCALVEAWSMASHRHRMVAVLAPRSYTTSWPQHEVTTAPAATGEGGTPSEPVRHSNKVEGNQVTNSAHSVATSLIHNYCTANSPDHMSWHNTL